MNAPRQLRVIAANPESEFSRYLIEDQKETVWDGTEFVVDRRQATLYANSNEASLDVHEILKRDLRARRRTCFSVPVVVEVYADKKEIVNPLEIAEWLSKTCRLHMRTSENGLGPDNSVVLPVIQWHLIEETTDE